MADTIFGQIIRGEIPAHKVHEDDKVLVFMDLYPIQPGQVLVIPKRAVEYVWDLPDEDYQAVMAAAKQAALRLRQAFPDKSRVAMHVEGLQVAHAHVKVFPFNDDEEFRRRPDMTIEPDHNQLAQLAQALAF